ncbi:MAG: NUDIX domain-containing protein [Planctomycetota bacterium]
MADITAAGGIMYMLEDGVPKYLILRSSHHGEWGPPKGHTDEGESELETAMREIFEETGFRRSTFIPGFREVLTYKVDKKKKRLNKEVVFFLCEMPSDDIEISDEHTEAHLATMAEIEIMLSHDDLKEIVRKADAFLHANVLKNADQ